MTRTIRTYALLAAVFAVLPASNLIATPIIPEEDPQTPTVAVADPEVQAHLDKGDELVAARKFGAARREYKAAAELIRAEGKLPVQAVRRSAISLYYEGRYQSAAKALDKLSTEAATYGDVATQVWALADAAWIDGIAGRKIDMERRLTRLNRLLTSPYLPEQVRAEVMTKRLGEYGAATAAALGSTYP
jgi:hypothetical protein